jgi:antitoxin FitA
MEPLLALVASEMASLHVRNLDEELVRRLKRRAVRHGRSAEAEHREILRQALSSESEMSWEQRAERLRERLKGRVHTPSEILIREDRDSR